MMTLSYKLYTWLNVYRCYCCGSCGKHLFTNPHNYHVNVLCCISILVRSRQATHTHDYNQSWELTIVSNELIPPKLNIQQTIAYYCTIRTLYMDHTSMYRASTKLLR